MKILQLDVFGFRSFKEQTWLPGDLNVLIGPNASGKSNLLRALEMLSLAAKGGLGEYVKQEGGMERLVWDGRSPEVCLRLKTSPANPDLDREKHALTYEIILERLGGSSAYRIGHELLGNFHKVEVGERDEPLKLLERDPGHAVIFAADEKRLTAAPESVSEEEALLSTTAGPFAANWIIAAFQQSLESWRIHHGFQTHRAAPVRSPQVARLKTSVSPDGQNLISVLHSLYTTNRDFKRELDVAMRAAFSDEFEELVFPPAADQLIQLRIRWRSLQREQPAADLSDGTLRFLYLLAVLANPSPPALIAIDEPETGLHPAMLPIIAEYAIEASNRSQIILTTHSPEFLDAFGDQAPTTTVVEWRDGETHLRVVSGDELGYWLQKYTLGELYRSSELEAMQ